MEFEVDDLVVIKPSQEMQSEELFRAVTGMSARVQNKYEAGESAIARVDLTLEKPVTVGNQKIIKMIGVPVDNLINADIPVKKEVVSENRAIESFLIFEAEESELNREIGEWYFGLADSAGIDAFVKEPEEIEDWFGLDTLLKVGLLPPEETVTPIRRQYNKVMNRLITKAKSANHMLPVIYRVKLLPEIANKINRLIKYGEYEEALILLKDSAIETQLSTEVSPNAKKRWTAIPGASVSDY